MDATVKIMKERNQMALDAVDKIDWELEPVKCDDYGDPYWKWHAVYTLDNEEVWEEYWHKKPDDVKVYNALLSVVKDGDNVADRIADILTQDDNYDKAEKELKGE